MPAPSSAKCATRSGSGNLYLDASFLVALLTPEAFSERAVHFVRDHADSLVVSDLAIAEFSSAISRRVRMREFTSEQALLVLAEFDAWSARSTTRIELVGADITAATAILRRLDLPLRTPDAIHVALALRLGESLVTFDARMAGSARALGIAVVTP